MNNHATIEKMKQMRLSGMVQVHSTGMQTQIYKDYTIDQYTAQLVDQEWESRQGAKIENLIKVTKGGRKKLMIIYKKKNGLTYMSHFF